MKLLKKSLLLILAILVIISSFMIFKGYCMCQEALTKVSLSTKIEEIQGQDSYISIEKLPINYRNAVISVEDRRFYEHSAVDLRSIGRAIVTNIKKFEIVEGGSTITQQLAKNLYFSQRQEFTRKIAEIFMAFMIEKNYSKDEILELYVNSSYFGDGYYGIKEACQGYLNKSPEKMTLDDATLMAGIPNAPSVYAPTKNPELAKKRQQHVKRTMIENGYINKKEAKD